MILRFLALVTVLIGLALPATARSFDAQSCPSQSQIELCHAAPSAAPLAHAKSFEQPCGGKAVVLPKSAAFDTRAREIRIVYPEARISLKGDAPGPEKRPPRS